MVKSNKKRDTGCPIAFALDIFGDRWSLIIIRDMLMKGYKTYGEFTSSDEKIATNILADRLNELESSGIILKTRDPENGRRVLYHLTKKGADLAPILLEMIRWSEAYDSNTIVTKEIINRIVKDRDAFAKKLSERALNLK